MPKYLEAKTKEALIQAFSKSPAEGQYYGPPQADPEPLQGDAWDHLVRVDYYTGQHDQVVGLILSNSCDIAAANDPSPDQRVLFAPLVDLDAFSALMTANGMSEAERIALLDNIRRQQVSTIFYLPPFGDLRGESIVALDDIYGMPLKELARDKMRRYFCLSYFGWYMLLFKLSIHFTRMGEEVKREGGA